MSAPVAPLPDSLLEEDFKKTVIDAAITHGWLVHHSRPAKTARGWRTPIEGHPGLPDLVLARDGVVIFAELKKHRAYPKPDQRKWLAAIGVQARVWRPVDWPAIVAELSQPRKAA
jgi:hypothetical protein